ncbi:LITD1 protein, partial [Crocuta crocuta]
LGLKKNIEDSRESLATEIKDLRNSHDKLRNAVNEVQNKLDAVTARMGEGERRISEIEDKIMENNEAEKKRVRKLLDHEGRIRDLSDSMKYNNIHSRGILEERREGEEGLFEQIMAKNFPKLGKGTDIQVQEAQRTPFKINKNRSTP